MVLGNLVVFVGDVLQTQLEVGLDLVVGLEQSATVVLGIKFLLGSSGIGDTGQRSADGSTTVRHAEDLGQDEVVIGTDHVSLTLDGVQTGLIGGSDGLTLNRAIASVPHTRGGIAAGDVEVDILPSVDLLVGLAIVTQVVTYTVIAG